MSRYMTLAAGCSDHSLVLAELAVGRPVSCYQRFASRNMKTVVPDVFVAKLSVRLACMIPADDVNTYADQLDHDITSVVDHLAPTRMKTRHCGKCSGRWLSDEAVLAKRQQRRLEARWRRTKLETDRVAYRKACRTANTHIVNSRRSFYQQ